MNNIPHTLRDKFLAPAILALGRSKKIRVCQTYPDSNHLFSGIERVIAQVSSGRDWVQFLQLKFNLDLSVSNFFMALKSNRRFNMVVEVSQDVRQQLDQNLLPQNDPFSDYPELDGFALYASDGHSHKASAHEDPIAGKKRAVTHVYSVNLRSHSLSHIALTSPQLNKKKEHEISTLKRIGGEKLRMGEGKGVKVIQVYDPAIIDYHQWFKWKKGYGLYILTLEKSNSALEVIGLPAWDRDDERNSGVISDELVGPSNGVVMRRVTYKDSVTGQVYRFITNELTLPPGLIAFLYKCRWDIEKIFDEVKNKMVEKKAWAKSETAKNQQAEFITLAHNLMVLLSHDLESNEGMVDKMSEKKRMKRLIEDEIKATDHGGKINPLVKACQRATQRCFQFIRWLRHCLFNSTPWSEAVDLLRPLMQNYLY